MVAPILDFTPSIPFLAVALLVALSLLALLTGVAGYLSGKEAKRTGGYWFLKEDSLIVAVAIGPCALFISTLVAVALAAVYLAGKVIGWLLNERRC